MNYQLFEKMYPTASETGTTPRPTTARSKLRLEKEPLRTMSGSEMDSVAGGAMPYSSCLNNSRTTATTTNL